MERRAGATGARSIIACPQSGSIILTRVFAEVPKSTVKTRLILRNKREKEAGGGTISRPELFETTPELAIFIEANDSGKRFVIRKREELRKKSMNERFHYEIWSTPSEYNRTKPMGDHPNFSSYTIVHPLFLIRDPIRVFDSWKSVGWTDKQSFVDCYSDLFGMLRQVPADAVSCVLYENLVQQPRTTMRRICRSWKVPFKEEILFIKTVAATARIDPSRIYHGLLSNKEKDEIEEKVGRQYISCWGADVARLRDVIHKKEWFGFDLDDTLHEFRRSSRAAAHSVLEQISRLYGTSMHSISEGSLRLLKEKTSNAFADGKTSFHCRKERFAALLAHFSLPQDEQFLNGLLTLYEETLMATLELKCGVIELFQTLASMGKRIAIITEGPHDAQERTLRQLGLWPYISFLATTGKFKVSKVNGLFPKVLEHLEIEPDNMVYIGHSEERDMKPAMAAGIFSIRFAEAEDVCLSVVPPWINTLRKLQYIISDA